MRKQLFVLFNYNKGIFTHILLNVLDLKEKSYEVGIIFESEACRFITEFEGKSNEKYEQLKEKNLVFAVCEVCAKSMNALESAQRQGLPINGELFGHPPFYKWIKLDYDVMLI
ncbi:MAG: cytoplasmic protein [Promethearchaeota archaeon]